MKTEKFNINPFERITEQTPNAKELLELEDELKEIFDKIVEEREETFDEDFNKAVGQTLIMILDRYESELSEEICKIFLARAAIINGK